MEEIREKSDNSRETSFLEARGFLPGMYLEIPFILHTNFESKLMQINF